MNMKTLKKICVFTGIVISFLIINAKLTCSDTAEANEKARAILFESADQALKNADQKNAPLFAPDIYKEAMDDYKDAESSYKKGKELSGIKAKLSKAAENFTKAASLSEKADIFFKSAKTARDDALKVDAVKHGSENWKKAEETFKDAVGKFADGKANKAKNDAKDAEVLYRKAELEAIKASYLGFAKKEIFRLRELGKNNNAKKMTAKAEKLVEDASKELDRQRYNNDVAKKLSIQAEYEIKRAAFNHARIQKLIEANGTYEDMVLAEETDISKISNELGVNATYEKGFDATIGGIIGAVQNQKNTIASLTNTVNQKNDEIAQKNKELAQKESEKSQKDAEKAAAIAEKDRIISELKGKVGSLEGEVVTISKTGEEIKKQKKSVEDELNSEKQAQLEKEAKLQKVRSILKPEEGKLLMDGENIVVRILGVSFDKGKTDIDPKYFSILTKVKLIFENYQGCKLTIEGNADAAESKNKKNTQKLSEARADSVKKYFLATSSIPADNVTTKGYGAERPVASGKDSYKNRRVDVVITPATK